MDRLTDTEANKCCYDTWDLCGLDNVCKRDCWKPTPCKIPRIVNKLTEYEDTGLQPSEIEKLKDSKTLGISSVGLEELLAYRALGTVEEFAKLKEATTDAWLQLRTATFSTNKSVADLAKFIISYLPEPPKEANYEL